MRERFHYLMIKRNKHTGLKYLCRKLTYTDEEAIQYLGSGSKWRLDIELYGRDKIEHVEIIFKCEESKLEEFKQVALENSFKFNVVESNEWANVIHEDGSTDRCGSTKENNVTKGMVWIYKNEIQKRVNPHELESYISNGWKHGYTESYRKNISNALKGKPAKNKGRQTKKLSEYKSYASKRKYGIISQIDPITKKLRKPQESNTTEKRRNTSKKCLNRPEVLAKFKTPRKPPITAQHKDGRIETHGRQQWNELYKVNYLRLLRGGISKNWKLVPPAGVEPAMDEL